MNLAYFLARLKEPSTWAAIFGAITAVGVSLPPGITQQITLAGSGIAGVLAFMLPERADK